MGNSAARSLAAKMLWAAFVLGAIGAISTGVSMATWIVGALRSKSRVPHE